MFFEILHGMMIHSFTIICKYLHVILCDESLANKRSKITWKYPQITENKSIGQPCCLATLEMRRNNATFVALLISWQRCLSESNFHPIRCDQEVLGYVIQQTTNI